MKIILTILIPGLIAVNLNAQSLTSFKDGKEWGYKDETGKVVIKAKYSAAWDFKDGIGLVGKKGKFGFIDGGGKEIIAIKYDYAYEFSDGLAAVKKDDKYGFIDRAGNIIIPLTYEEVNSFSEGFAVVKLNGKYGYIDKTGKEFISPKYAKARDFKEGLAAVKPAERFGYIDKTGKEVIQPLYTDADNFSDGLAAVRLYGKYGYIDKTDNLVIDHTYEYAGEFSNGKARVRLNDKYFYIDKTGKNDEIRKKEAEEKAEEEKQKKLLAEALEKKDENAAEVYRIYQQNNSLLFTKVNSLNEYLKSSMQQNAKGEFTLTRMWGSISIQMKEQYCKDAASALEMYKKAMGNITIAEGKNELYRLIKSYLVNVQGYISACNAWAEFIKDQMNAFDDKAIVKQMDYINKPLQAMAKDERAIQSFISIYKKRNGL